VVSNEQLTTKSKWVITVYVIYYLSLVSACVIEYKVLFSWPLGIVVGNLLANCIWVPLQTLHLDQLARKHHRENMKRGYDGSKRELDHS
jgi:hypothetical protein